VGSAYPFFINLKKYNIMACNFISAGRALACKDSVGGIKAVIFVPNDASNKIVADATDSATGAIDSLVANVAGAYKYELKGTSSLEETITASADNGTVFYEQALNLTLPKLSATDTKEIKLLAASRPQIIVQDYNNNYMVVGLENGADVSGGTIVTGTAMGDMSGYTLVFSGMETSPASHLDVESDTGTVITLDGTDSSTITYS
jgi:hypothetical protein